MPNARRSSPTSWASPCATSPSATRTRGAALVEAGIGPKAAHALVEIDGLFREGFGAPVTDVVERVTGRTPRDFRTFARENAALFQ